MRRALALCMLLSGLGMACDDDGPYYGGPGGPCRDDRDCPRDAKCEHRAQGGECTYVCRFHEDCPPGWACVDSHGGTCHSLCRSDRDCPIELQCKRKNNEGDRGDSDVCES